MSASTPSRPKKPRAKRAAGGKAATKAAEAGPLGFGFQPAESQHHFLVTVPKGADRVFVSEHYEWDESDARRELSFSLGGEDNKLRVVLPRVKWDGIADHARAAFNQRLRDNGMPAGAWPAAGQTPVSRLLGKELVLLAWAIEDADPALIPQAVRNWHGLAPEERWWLFTMTNAATGHAVAGRGKGWRKAVRFALTDNPTTGSATGYEPTRPTFGLFRETSPEVAAWASTAGATRAQKITE